jgi:hypothetical protein
VEEAYRRTFQVNATTGLMFVPEGEGAKLDFESVNYFYIEVTVRDRCEDNFCFLGKLEEKCCDNIFLYWQ